MLHDLLAMDLTGWHPRDNIPKTAAKATSKSWACRLKSDGCGIPDVGNVAPCNLKYPSRVRQRSKMYDAARASIHELRFGWHDARF